MKRSPIATFIDKKFGRLTVISEADRRGRNRRVKCLCVCGKEVEMVLMNLKSGHSKSCGCLRMENESRLIHGHSRKIGCSREYKTWVKMRERCKNTNSTQYKYYGGRGISICERWQTFENFLTDMGERPVGYSIERINNNLGYCLENCKWASQVDQCNNKRTNRIITFNGLSLTLAQWSRKTGVNRGTINSRISRDGWPLEKALAP